MDETNRRPTFHIVLELAAPTHGWFRSRDAFERGVSASALSRLRSRGVVDSPGHGVNRISAIPDSWEGRALGAAWSAGPGAALGRGAAVRLIEERRSSPRIDVVVPRAGSIRNPLVAVRTHVRLTPEDVQLVRGFPVTSPAFTLCDLAAVAGRKRVLTLADRWIAEERLSLEDLHTMVTRFRAIEGIETMRSILTELSPASRWTRSDGERAWRRALRVSGLPDPVANLRVIDADGRRRYLDFAYPDLMLAIEIDLHPDHTRTVGRAADGARQNALVLAGWTVLRFDLADLMLRPDHVVSTMIRAYEAALAAAARRS